MTPSQHEIGFVYVLTNVSMPDLVKVGLTTWLPEDRARDLHTTGLPTPFEVAFQTATSRPKAVESRAHEILAEHRVNPRREFFRVSVAEAVEAVRLATVEAAGIESWSSPHRYILKSSNQIALTLEAGQIFALIGWQSFQAMTSGDPAEIIDLWQAHSDGDLLEIFVADSPGPVAGLSDNHFLGTEDPLPYLDRKNAAANGMLIGREILTPGERLLWISAPEAEKHVSVIFEAAGYCQVAARTWSPRVTEHGGALLLNHFTHSNVWPEAADAVHKALALPTPRTWAPRTGRNPDEWAPIGNQRVDPTYWLPQLLPRSQRKKKRGRSNDSKI